MSSPSVFHFTLLRLFSGILSPISYKVMVSFAFFVFVRHTAHCFLLLVSCMLYVVKKHCPDEAYLNRWAKRAKRRQNNEIIARRSNLSA